MNYQALLVGITIVALSGGTALAQNTLGDVLDAGGKQLTKGEVLTTLGGATVSGPTPDGGMVDVNFKADGTLSGTVQAGLAGNDRVGGIYGKWTVDETGKICLDVTIKIRDSRQLKPCFFYYRVADQFYVTNSDSSDRSTPVLKRTIKH